MTQQTTFTVREARERRRPPMTQEQLADKSGFDQTYISLIERGLRAPKDPDTKRRLAKALGIAPSRLVFSTPSSDAISTPDDDRAGHALPTTRTA